MKNLKLPWKLTEICLSWCPKMTKTGGKNERNISKSNTITNANSKMTETSNNMITMKKKYKKLIQNINKYYSV